MYAFEQELFVKNQKVHTEKLLLKELLQVCFVYVITEVAEKETFCNFCVFFFNL